MGATRWDRPSEGTVPAVLAVDAVVLHSDVVAIAVDRLEVYPNGFTIHLLMRVDPRKVREMMEMLRPLREIGGLAWGFGSLTGEPLDADLALAPCRT